MKITALNNDPATTDIEMIAASVLKSDASLHCGTNGGTVVVGSDRHK